MTEELKQLVDETIELIGVDAPAMLNADAPILASSETKSVYLIGLVGGKDVGKSSLVNAIVGQPISAPTSYGPGTQTVIAYAHESSADELKEMLSRHVPGRFTIITHRIDPLKQQALLDLPDIDSKYADHVQITRKMLRHMLYPLWIQSIEKYADRRPQELLAAVAEGNDPANFIFCLNKADQLKESEAREIRDDYARRIAKAIGLSGPPRVNLISAEHPDKFDLPQLRELLSRGRSDGTVKQSLSLAERRQDRSLFTWLGRQNLSQRIEQLGRLERDAEEIAATRIAMPLLDGAIPKLLDDPGLRMSMLEPAVRLRLSRWPVVNAIDSLLSPLLLLVQKNLSASSTTSADPDVYLDGAGSVSSNVQGAFAQLHQLHPELGSLYQDRKPWEALYSDFLAADLRRRFATAIDRQRETILQRAAGRFAPLFLPIRWLLTIGAIVWFPFLQPIVKAMLAEDRWEFSKQTLRIIVDALSVAHMLQCATFLLIWFGVLWLMLRWSTQRAVLRVIERWKNSDAEDELSLPAQTISWMEELTEPIRRRRERLETIVKRAEQLTAS